MRRLSFVSFVSSIASAIVICVPQAALAGTFSSASYSGGTISGFYAPPGYPDSDPYSSSQWDGTPMGAYGSSAECVGSPAMSCSGAITAAFTWQPAYSGEPAPQNAILYETSEAEWDSTNNYPAPGATGSVSNPVPNAHD